MLGRARRAAPGREGDRRRGVPRSPERRSTEGTGIQRARAPRTGRGRRAPRAGASPRVAMSPPSACSQTPDFMVHQDHALPVLAADVARERAHAGRPAAARIRSALSASRCEDAGMAELRIEKRTTIADVEALLDRLREAGPDTDIVVPTSLAGRQLGGTSALLQFLIS